ncbi:hypothetical protein [Myroides odoratus]|uniref:hypothetical protein n=1 Tax=Myroides odoratus TaxID=256 RepID=UPI0033422BE6
MLSNSLLEFLKDLKSDNFYPFTQDIDDDIYNFILELKNKQIVQIEDYQVSIINYEAIDQMINTQSLDCSDRQNHQQNQSKKTDKPSLTKKIISAIFLLAAIAGIISLILDITKSTE